MPKGVLLTSNETDQKWGLTANFAVMLDTYPGDEYPPSYPKSKYQFSPDMGRVLTEYQLTFIAKGRGVFACEACGRDRQMELTEGCVFILFPGEWHSYRPDPETGWTEYSIGFNGSYMDSLVANHFLSKDRPILNVKGSENMRQMFTAAVEAAFSQHRGYQQLIAGTLYHILGTAYYHECNKDYSSPDIVEKMNMAKNIIEGEFATITPPELSERLNMGYSNFRRLFKEYTGFSPAKYIIEMRILKAKELLSFTTQTVKEVSFSIGMENYDYFSVMFHARTGYTPSDYRAYTRGQFHI